MFDAIKAHCLVFLRDSANGHGLGKAFVVWAAAGGNGVAKIVQHRKMMDMRTMPWRLH